MGFVAWEWQRNSSILNCMRKTALLALLIAVASGLSGCRSTHQWHQKLTVIVDTPTGRVSGSSVIAVNAKFGSMPLTDREVWYRITGEATAVEVAPGRYLFALLGNSKELYYRSLQHKFGHRSRKEWLKRIPNMKEVVTLEGKRYPQLITFRKTYDPKTASKVRPDYLSASFGKGFKLIRITLEITNEPVTEGRINAILPWIDEPALRKNPSWRSLPRVTQMALRGLKKEKR